MLPLRSPVPDTTTHCQAVDRCEMQHWANQRPGGKERVQAVLCKCEVKLSLQQAMEAHRVVRRRRSRIY
jgi:hypothetical protein